MGPINDEVVVAICALILVAVCLHYHIKVSTKKMGCVRTFIRRKYSVCKKIQ